MGILLVVAVIIGAIATSGIGGTISGLIGDMIDSVSKGDKKALAPASDLSRTRDRGPGAQCPGPLAVSAFAMRSRRHLAVFAVLCLGGCGGSDFEGDVDVPDGYATYKGNGVSFVHPEDWQATTKSLGHEHHRAALPGPGRRWPGAVGRSRSRCSPAPASASTASSRASAACSRAPAGRR